MAIYSRYGTEIKITDCDNTTGLIEIKYPTGNFADVAIYELKADGGVQEIDEAIKALKRKGDKL